MQANSNSQSNDPLHGITLKMIIEHLVEYYGWQELGNRVNIKCFQVKPSINSSLRFLRQTPWAREKVESLYLYSLRKEKWKQEKLEKKEQRLSEHEHDTTEFDA